MALMEHVRFPVDAILAILLNAAFWGLQMNYRLFSSVAIAANIFILGMIAKALETLRGCIDSLSSVGALAAAVYHRPTPWLV